MIGQTSDKIPLATLMHMTIMSFFFQSSDRKIIPIHNAPFRLPAWDTSDRNTDGYIPLYVKAQKAGLIVSKVGSDIVFAVFELSPHNEAVSATKGRLVRSFPACGLAVTQNTFNEEGFIPTLAQAVAKMSYQPAPDAQPRVRKAGQRNAGHYPPELGYRASDEFLGSHRQIQGSLYNLEEHSRRSTVVSKLLAVAKILLMATGPCSHAVLVFSSGSIRGNIGRRL